MPRVTAVAGLRRGSRRLDRALYEGQARLARHFATIEHGDPVDIHQARIACRRLRSLLKSFKPHFDRRRAAAYRRKLGRVAGLCAEVRELDVLATQPGMRRAPVLRALTSAREAGVRHLRRRLHTAAGLRALALDGPTAAQLGLDPDLTGDDVVRTVRRRWRRVDRLLRHDTKQLEVSHELRIELKNLRYIIESTQDLCGSGIDALQAGLRAAQAFLGEERDLACARAWLERSGLPAAVNRGALGQLQRRSRALAARRPGVLRRLERAGRRWYQSDQ